MLKYKLIKVTINAFNSLIIIFVILIDKVNLLILTASLPSKNICRKYHVFGYENINENIFFKGKKYCHK